MIWNPKPPKAKFTNNGAFPRLNAERAPFSIFDFNLRMHKYGCESFVHRDTSDSVQ